VTRIWALWHLPFFFSVSTYRGFAPAGYVGFVFSLGCGSIILTWLYNGSGGSILASAIWHGLYNVETGTAAAARRPRLVAVGGCGFDESALGFVGGLCASRTAMKMTAPRATSQKPIIKVIQSQSQPSTQVCMAPPLS
jgi:hypothetical protein